MRYDLSGYDAADLDLTSHDASMIRAQCATDLQTTYILLMEETLSSYAACQ